MQALTSDVIVIGGGAMGTATVFELAKRGATVRLFEQFAIGHDLGSSHGYSRIIRRAYYEHPDYVPFVDRAYELWRELEKNVGERLLEITGIIEMGGPGSPLLKGSLASCTEHSIPHELLDAQQISARFPQFAVPSWMRGVWQKDAGILAVERCILAFRLAAKNAGAQLHEEEEVLTIEPHAGGVTVRTRKGSYSAAKAVVCAGSWAGKVLADLNLPLCVTRQALGFFTPKKRALFELGTFPLFLMELYGHSFYGFPFFGVDCMKVASHSHGKMVTPETVDRQFNSADEAELRDFLDAHIPDAAGRLNFGKICLYTNTPDGHFILDAHPNHPSILIAAGFSGHGFKFASVVGETMAELCSDGKTRHKISLFSLSRFSK
ncbi:MAG: N-methyl-L-tryptophan oxidase [Planctomycetota bacterium]